MGAEFLGSGDIDGEAMSDRVRVQIVGDHPWAGHAGTLVSVQKPSIGILPVMGRVLLDDAPDVPHAHECFVESKHLRPLKGEKRKKEFSIQTLRDIQ